MILNIPSIGHETSVEPLSLPVSNLPDRWGFILIIFIILLFFGFDLYKVFCNRHQKKMNKRVAQRQF